METHHVKMLCDISELNGLFEETSLQDILLKTVDMVSRHMDAQVCSIYLLNEKKTELILKATRGLKQSAVDNVILKPGEGLVGNALKEMTVICENTGSKSPLYKHQPGIDEELYDAFLAVPITIGKKKIGVLVVQRHKENCFNEEDVMAIKATASQLASMLENINLLMALSFGKNGKDLIEENGTKPLPSNFLKGKSASKGYSLSRAHVIRKTSDQELISKEIFSETFSLADFENAIIKTEKQLELLQQKVEEKLSDAASLIFAYHLLMLKDRGFVGAMRELIEAGENPPSAIIAIYMKYRGLFSKSPNPLIKEKIQDIEDLTKRVLDNLLDRDISHTNYHNHIVIAEDLFPSDLLKLSADEADGIILVNGGVTSHVSILARSLQIPLVYADKPALLEISDKTEILLDADQGNIYINPSEDVIAKFKENEKARKKLEELSEHLTGPAVTRNGTPVSLMVNINLLSDLKQLTASEIDGIGLYRTEFPFMIRSNFPSEEEQIVVYKRLLADMGSKPVTFRTLDIGGDKVLSYYETSKEENPFLGMRSIRFSLTHEEIFKQQIRAILRAGIDHNIKIMFPMISSIEELLEAKKIVALSIEELKSGDYEFNESPEIGIMIEIPSAVNIIEDLAMEADFFSIGTNDLVQYTLAVDRTNEKVADLYVPHHPAILRSLKIIADAANKHTIDVSICGDMASDERYIPFFLGIGITTLSIDPIYLPRAKMAISKIEIDKAEDYSRQLLSTARINEINKIMEGAPGEKAG